MVRTDRRPSRGAILHIFGVGVLLPEGAQGRRDPLTDTASASPATPKLETKLEWARKTLLLHDTILENAHGFQRLALAGLDRLLLKDVPGLTIVPFMERDGIFAGYPGNAGEAITEVE